MTGGRSGNSSVSNTEVIPGSSDPHDYQLDRSRTGLARWDGFEWLTHATTTLPLFQGSAHRAPYFHRMATTR
jgi:hypothetical protein